jgi:hypothetical protein
MKYQLFMPVCINTDDFAGNSNWKINSFDSLLDSAFDLFNV